MSTKLSFKEALGGPKAGSRARPASPAVGLILRAGEMPRPVDVSRLLARYGHSLRKAHAALNRLAAGDEVSIEFQATDAKRLRLELSKFGVTTRIDRRRPDAGQAALTVRE